MSFLTEILRHPLFLIIFFLAVVSTTGTYIPVEVVQTTAFGEQTVANKRAYIQASPVYDLLPANFRSFTNGTASSAGVNNRMFEVQCGTDVGGYGTIQSFRALNYKAGEGGEALFTAIFDTGTASTIQGVGLVSLGDEISFGYNGTAFGVWHKRHGLAECRTITITGAASGSETLSLTLDGTLYSIPLTSGSVQHNAHEIESWINDDANQTVWKADQIDDEVKLIAQDASSRSGTYTFSSSTATGTIAQDKAGAAKTETHIAQASWNGIEPFSGFDPTLGNVYKIDYQYLGFGVIRYYLENPEDGEFDLVHTIEYPNTATTPSLGNPSLRAGLYVASTGGTTNLTVNCGSFGLFVQGTENPTRNPRAEKNTQSVSGSFTNVFTIRNRRTYNGYYNQVELEPKSLTISNEASKDVEIELIAGSSDFFSGDTDFRAIGTNLVTDIDTTTNTLTGTYRLLGAYTVAGNGTLYIDLTREDIRIPPSLRLAIVARVTSGPSANVTGALTWLEDL